MNRWLGIGSVLVALSALWWWHREAPTSIEAQIAQESRGAREFLPATPPEELPQPKPAEVAVRASEPLPTEVENYQDWLREIVASLASQMQDANSLLTAAMIVQTFESTRTPELRTAKLLADAHAQAPLDAVVASAAMRLCGKLDSCDPLPYEKALRSIDARNELSFITPVLNAAQSGSTQDLVNALNAVRDHRLRLYTGELAVRARRAIAAAATSALYSPPTSDLERLKDELTVRILTAIPPPAYDLLIERCRTSNFELRIACDREASKLARSEMLTLQSIALSIKQSASFSRAGGLNAPTQEETYLRWLTGALADHPPPAGRWIGLLQTSETEFSAARRWLEVRGASVPRAPRALDPR